MKLRIQANSIRFRVTPNELNALATRGRIESSVQLGGAASDRLLYALETSSDSTNARATYSHGVVCVTLPENLVREWASTDQIGIEEAQPVAGDLALKILVEKDFKCLQPRPDESETDRFPNPGEPAYA